MFDVRLCTTYYVLFTMTQRQRTANAGARIIIIDSRQRTQFGPHPRRWDAAPGRRGSGRLAAPPAYHDNTMRITVMGVTSRPFCRIQCGKSSGRRTAACCPECGPKEEDRGAEGIRLSAWLRRAARPRRPRHSSRNGARYKLTGVAGVGVGAGII